MNIFRNYGDEKWGRGMVRKEEDPRIYWKGGRWKKTEKIRNNDKVLGKEMHRL
jgi:hypothetical protein